MICPRCKNSNEQYFERINDKYYCRKCIQFGRTYVDEEVIPNRDTYSNQGYYKLDYTLSDEQDKISKQLVQRFIEKKDSTVRAVCGAGKTEIVYEVIRFALQNGQRVCFTTPRTELTKELYHRIKEQFYDVVIHLVCGGHHDEIYGQFIVCTTHQLFRFEHCFDLLILDEYDAFPYLGDKVLNEILHKSVRGNKIYLSATMSCDGALELSKRYHGYLIPVPCFIKIPFMLSLLCCVYKIHNYKKENKPVLVFVCDIHRCVQVNKLFNKLFIKSMIVHSKTNDGLLVLNKLKQNDIDVIVCTTILERGVTIENGQVLVLEGEQRIYDYRTLIQIAGRVGRKIHYPKGDVVIYGVFKTKDIQKCISLIKKDNASVV